MPVRGIAMLVFFVASLPVCFFRPFYGILLWYVVSFLNPQSSLFYWSIATSFPWALAVAIPTLAGLLLFSKQWPQRLVSREIGLIAVLWVWFTITSVVSSHVPLFADHAQDTWDKWVFVSKILLMMLATIAIVDTFARLRMLVIVMSGCFGFIVLKYLPSIITSGGGIHIYGPAFSMVGDNNDLGLALNMTLPLFIFLAQSESNRRLKWVFGLMAAFTVPAIFCTYSRGGLIGLVAMIALIFLQLKVKKKVILAPLIVFVVVAVVLFAPPKWKERMNPGQGLDSSARERINAWTFSWNLTKESPVFGGGFGTFTPELFQRFAPVVDDVHGPHSVYFGVLAEHGFVGLALYLTLVASCFAKGHRLAKYGRIYGDQVVVNYAKMFQFSLTGFLVSGVFLGRAYFDYFFAIVACLIILDRLAGAAWETPSEDEAEETDELVEDGWIAGGAGVAIEA